MTCSDTRAKLTAYLDGELDGDRGTVVRGHLRTCDACRDIAEREAKLRDGLRALPAVDPPASLWANVQAKLADLEVAEAQRPAWRRALARFAPRLPHLALAGTALAAAAVLLWWRHQPAEVAPPDNKIAIKVPTPIIKPDTAPLCKRVDMTEKPDVTADLEAEPDRVTAMYCDEAEQQLAAAASATWSADQRKAFDARVVELRARIDQASEPRLRNKALRELIRFTQNSITRESVALAEVAP